MKQFITLIATAAVLAACSGAQNALPVASGPAAVAAPARQARTATATFTIHWPAPASKTNRRPAFVSPKARSLVIEVDPAAAKPGATVIANDPGTGKAQTITFEAPVGDDSFVFSLWDAPQKKRETAPAGNELGQAQLPHKTIVANGKNALHVTIDGIAASVGAAPLPGQTFLEPDARTGGYDLVGGAPATFVLTAYDAAGAVIVPPGAPRFALAASVNSAPYLKVAPVRGKPDEFSVRRSAINQVTNPLALVPSAIDATGISKVQGAPLPISTRSAIYVSYAVGKASKILAFDDLGNLLPLPASAFSGLQNPTAMIFDPADRRIFVADAGLGSILAFDANGSPAKGYHAPSLAGANGVTFDADANRIFASGTSSVIAFRPATGAAIPLSQSAFSSTAQPQGITYVASSQLGGASGVVRRVIVGNAATFSADFYDDSGNYVQTNPINTQFSTPVTVAPIRGMLFDNAVPSFPTLLVAGGSAGNGFLIDQLTFGFDTGGTPLTSATTAFAGIAIDPAMNGDAEIGSYPGEVFIAEPDAGVVQGMGDPLENLGPDAFALRAPASSSLAQPQGVAIAY